MINTKNTMVPARGTIKGYTPSRLVTHAPYAKENARNATKFEGRRYLGQTANGKDVWINFKIERDSTKSSAKKTMKVWSTVDTSLLLEDGAKFADKRVSFGTGVPMRGSLDAYLNDRMNTHGRVTPRTLEWLNQVIGRCPEENPRRSQFLDVANMIFVGTTEDCNVKGVNTFTAYNLLSEWNLRPNYG